jgi:hypothetical protein
MATARYKDARAMHRRPVSASRLQVLAGGRATAGGCCSGGAQRSRNGPQKGCGEGGGERVMGRRIGGGQADWTRRTEQKSFHVGIWACQPLRALPTTDRWGQASAPEQPASLIRMPSSLRTTPGLHTSTALPVCSSVCCCESTVECLSRAALGLMARAHAMAAG